ncbi:MAG: phenylacetic acid degradation protein [Chloroflexota bacterium]
MNNSDWPRYEVFQQDREGRPFQNVGSVHAPDAEMALLNARNVFVRRPRCHTLWVVPAEAVFMKTAEELTLDDSWQQDESAGQLEAYAVFTRTSHRRSMTHVEYVGDVEADSGAAAMKLALSRFSEGDPFVWWVCPVRLIHKADEDDADSLFGPAQDKAFRMPNEYRTVFTMQKMKRDA